MSRGFVAVWRLSHEDQLRRLFHLKVPQRTINNGHRIITEFLNHLPGFVLHLDNHSTIHFRIRKMSIVDSASITNRAAECELIEETVISVTVTNDAVVGVGHREISGTNVIYQVLGVL